MDGDKIKYYRWNEEDLQRALLALEKKEMSLNKISAKYSVPKPTILRHAKKKNKIANDSAIHKGRPTTFSMELENILVKHILELEKYMFGLTINDVRKLAFDIAEKHNICHKFNKQREMAGKAWFYAFKGRHSELSVRQPESTSINRVKGFNRQNVYGFYDLLEKIIDENSLTAAEIFNVDESGFSTVQKKPQKVVGLKGKKQVGALTSGERGVNTTAVCCASATGQFVPPMLIFKRMRQNPELANGAPHGSIVTVSESGYINSALFVEWIKHFISVVKPSLTKKVLLLLDGHTTHSKNLEALILAKDNGIIMLQLPGHTTHRLQPLDVSFFKPMSTYYIQAMEKWLRTNPGRQVTQYQVASLFSEAYGRAAVIGTISNGFRAAGVWPVDRNIFPEYLFTAAENMDAESSKNTSHESTSILQDVSVVNNKEISINQPDQFNQTKSNGDGTDDKKMKGKENSPAIQLLVQSKQSKDSPQPSTSGLNTKEIRKSLQSLCPIPKNTQRKKNTVQKAVEITSSPYKNKLEEAVTVKQKKNTEKDEKSKKQIKDKKSKGPKKDRKQSNKGVQKKHMGKTQKRKRSSSTSSDDCEDVVLVLEDDSEDVDEENVCALCDGHYFDRNGPNVDWIQCIRCHRWVHETCTSNPDICDNCLN